MRPDIAQAIHDAAVADHIGYLDTVASMILCDAFVSIIDWSRAAEQLEFLRGLGYYSPVSPDCHDRPRWLGMVQKLTG